MIKELLSEEIQAYINEHLNDDVADLGLRSDLRHHSFFKEILEQIKSKKRAQSKLPTWFAQTDIIFPPTLSMEQCSSELTAQYKAQLLSGKNLADLTGGFGIDTYYLSQQFEKTEYVEQNEKLSELAAHNFTVFGANIKVNHQTSEEFLKQAKSFDWIYLDPARRDGANHKVYRLEDCTPDILNLQNALFEKSAKVLVKLSPMLDIKRALAQLTGVKEVHVTSVKNEVKELLLILERGFEGVPQVCCVNLGQNEVKEFCFNYEQEAETISDFSSLQHYLYEPNAAIMKAGAFKSVGARFNLKKLGLHTHLYTSNERVGDFPGRTFEVVRALPLNKKLKSAFPAMKANIAVRNYPLSVQQIRKKTGIKEGGVDYIFAFSDKEAKRFVLCTKA